MVRIPLVLVLVLVLVLGAACTPRNEPALAAPKPVAVDVPHAPPVPAPPEDPIVRARADDAVPRLASVLEVIEDRCRARWEADEDACAGAPFAPIAEAYAAFYSSGAHDDPRIESGPIDALPRLGADHATPDVLVIRMGLACQDRCGIARRMAIGDALSAAAEACAEGGAGKETADRACAALAKGKAQNSAAQAAVDYCEDRCKAERESAHERAVRERSRPRNAAERAACLRKCVARGVGAKLVFEGGELHAEATDFCGTPAVTCEFNCAIRERVR